MFFFEGDRVAYLSGCIDFMEVKVTIGRASVPVLPSSSAIVLLPMLPFVLHLSQTMYYLSN